MKYNSNKFYHKAFWDCSLHKVYIWYSLTFSLKWGTLNRSLPQDTTFGSEAWLVANALKCSLNHHSMFYNRARAQEFHGITTSSLQNRPS